MKLKLKLNHKVLKLTSNTLRFRSIIIYVGDVCRGTTASIWNIVLKPKANNKTFQKVEENLYERNKFEKLS